MEAAYAADNYDQAKGQLLTLMGTLEGRCLRQRPVYEKDWKKR